jgi:uncharacterized protein YjbI with pentapeptide repeats
MALRGDLGGARFDHAVIEGIDFRGAILRGASFKRAFIASTTFGADDMRGASFERANLYGGVGLTFARLEDAVFDNADIPWDTTFYRSLLDNASFVRTKFEKPERGRGGTDFRCVQGRGVDFSHAVNRW